MVYLWYIWYIFYCYIDNYCYLSIRYLPNKPIIIDENIFQKFKNKNYYKNDGALSNKCFDFISS